MLTGVLTTWATVGRPPQGDYEYILWQIGADRELDAQELVELVRSAGPQLVAALKAMLSPE